MTDELREMIEAEYVVEREGWAFERVQRVSAQLQRAVAEADRFDTVVLWTDSHNAFTGPGKTVYFGRQLLQRLPDDDAAAFVIAHEIAHHRLGHIPTLRRALLHLPTRVVIMGLERWIATTERETDADLLAIEMCIDAGYDVERCLHALEQLTMVALDYGDIDGALGPENGPLRGTHPPLIRRIAAARTHAQRVRTQGYRISLDLDARRRERRRRIAIAAGAAAATIALLVIRRR